ncbi:hypothetical protein GOFOIKOB_4990 [Methylobacterium tardum]|nr:hypothetical protein GOFOIKOB_4990 [Methylobacterium tardum]
MPRADAFGMRDAFGKRAGPASDCVPAHLW